MAQGSPTRLATPRNIALAKGTASGGFAEPVLAGVEPISSSTTNHTTGKTPPPATPNPYALKGA